MYARRRDHEIIVGVIDALSIPRTIRGTEARMKKASLLCILLMTAIAATPQPSANSITFFTDKELRRAIRTAPEQPGQPGLYALRLSPPTESEVLGIRRTTVARSEQHANFTDIWYVIDGKATLVTGGTIQDSVETVPGEKRGRAITNGSPRTIRKGDYAVIPAGIPHWISKVDGKEFLYIVVKVPVENTAHR
jgi:quercetin dioxygenase-like cupin family protein